MESGGNRSIEENDVPKWMAIDKKRVLLGSDDYLMREAQITKDDVGKFFVIGADGTGKIMTDDEMYALEIDQISEWHRIGQLDVNYPDGPDNIHMTKD